MCWAHWSGCGVFCSSTTTTKSSASYRPHTTAEIRCWLFCLGVFSHFAPHAKGQCVNGSMSHPLDSKQSTLLWTHFVYFGPHSTGIEVISLFLAHAQNIDDVFFAVLITFLANLLIAFPCSYASRYGAMQMRIYDRVNTWKQTMQPAKRNQNVRLVIAFTHKWHSASHSMANINGQLCAHTCRAPCSGAKAFNSTRCGHFKRFDTLRTFWRLLHKQHW